MDFCTRRDLISDKNEIQHVLKSNLRRFNSTTYMWGIDNNQNPVSDFDNSDLRILVCFLSSGRNRFSSNTFIALHNIVKEVFGDRVFIDYAYFPDAKDLPLMEELKLPIYFGNVSHRPVRDYDVVFLSQAILEEALNVPYALYNSGIPLSHEERMQDDDLPLMMFGGASAATTQILHGEFSLTDQQRGSGLVDLCQFGYGEGVLSDIVQELIDYKLANGSVKSDKRQLITHLLDNSSQRDYLFYPSNFHYEHDEDGWTIRSIEKVNKSLGVDKPKYSSKYLKDHEFPNFTQKIFNLDGSHVDAVTTFISMGCSSHLCTFCYEGITGGGWRQRSVETLKNDFKEHQRFAAANSVSAYSYNTNFYAPFIDLLAEMSQRFSRLSLQNMRADVIAADSEYLELSKAMGQMRVSMAVEGMGERVRDKILNKNLSREVLLKAIDNTTKYNFTLIKLGLIATAEETDEDIDEFISELAEMIEIRDRNGSKAKFQLSITPLVIYNSTPLRWFHRSAAKVSLSGEKHLKRLTNWCKENKIRIKINGSGPGTYLSQLVLDSGRGGTDMLVRASIQHKSLFIRHLDVHHLKVFEQCAKETHLNHHSIFRERSMDEIFPDDVIEFVPPQKIELWKDQYKKKDFYVKHCLRSVAATKTRCYTCGSCNSKEDILSIVKRALEAKNTIPEVRVALSDFRHVSTTRVVVQMRPEWFFVSKTMLSHYISSLFLRSDDFLLDSFYSVGKNSTYWVSSDEQKDYYGGKFVFEIKWKQPITSRNLSHLVESVNEKLDSCRVLSVSDVPRQSAIDRNAFVSYSGFIKNCTFSQFKNKLESFDWQVRVAQKTPDLGLILDKENHPELNGTFHLLPVADGIKYFVTLPVYINPYLFFASILNWNYDKIVNLMTADVIDHHVHLDASCSCGRSLPFSLFENSALKRCAYCLGKIIISKK